MKLTVDGNELEFTKASRSHIDGKECLYVASDGDRVHLVESENKHVLLTTSRANFAAFIEGAREGNFDFAV